MSSSPPSKSLTTRFKCLVVINDNKYSISIDNDLKDITFMDVLNELKKQLDKKPIINITHETHSFEIYDSDFEEYVVVTNEDMVIENLSRIRLIPKRRNKLTQTENQVFIKDNISCDTISAAFKPINAVTVTPLKTLSLSSSPLTVASLKPINTTNNIAISSINTSKPNAVNNKNNDNSIVNGLNASIETDSDLKFRCHSLLAQFVHRFNDYFVANRLNQTNAWQLVSNEMIKNNYKTYSGVVCKREFNNLISVYVSTLQTATKYENACTKYRLFAKLNAMDLWAFMNPITYEKVIKIKESKFGIKSDKSRTLISKQFETRNSPFVSKVEDNQQNFIANKFDVKVDESEQKDDLIDETVIQKTVKNIKQEKGVTVIPNFDVQLNGSQNISNIKTESQTNRLSVKPKSKTRDLELPQSAINSVLIACVKRHEGLLCDLNTPLDHLWVIVSDNMRDFRCPQKYCTPQYCEQQFNNLLSQLKAVLQISFTAEEARSQFSLFDELSSINLKPLLSRKVIDEIDLLKRESDSVISIKNETINEIVCNLNDDI